jgi:carbon storage regulator CsrA
VLVLSRRVRQKIVFPDRGITVQVTAVKPGVVRLGIEAPRDVSVVREEVLDGSRASAHRASAELCPV